MLNRIVGLETEFGCLVRDPALGAPEDVVERVKNAAFRSGRWGLLDLHTRDMYFEPAEAGGFLFNGGRLYVDAVGTHLEYCTPECRSLRDLITYDKAGQRLILRVLEQLGWKDKVSFHNNSIDHFGGHTFGCHENYSVKPETLSHRSLLAALIPFLVTRQIFAGAGRVGGHRLTLDWQSTARELARHPADYVFLDQVYGVEPDPKVSFQLSQRADHILHLISGRVRFSRAIINPKWDQVKELSRAPRLHLLFGESNVSEYATFLKVGTTALVLDLLEEQAAPSDLELDRPLRALKEVSRDPTWQWIVRLQNGRTISAIELQRLYVQKAQKHLAGRDEETDQVLDEWEAVLDALERDPMSLADRLDWVAKRKMIELYMEAEGLDWGHDVMHSLDLEYHNIDPNQGLYYALDGMSCITADEAIERAMLQAPSNTRALGRARVVKGLRDKRLREYVIEWDGVYAGPERVLVLENPFETYADEAERFLKRLY